MPDTQPNKPDGEIENGEPEPVEDRGAIENQGQVTPENYPDDADGKPDYGGN